MKTQRLRGQAFVVFKDVTAATTAMRQLQGLLFFAQDGPVAMGAGPPCSPPVQSPPGSLWLVFLSGSCFALLLAISPATKDLQATRFFLWQNFHFFCHM